MKNKILIYFGLILLPFAYSCDDDDVDVRTPEPYVDTWQDLANLKFAPTVTDGPTAFEYNVEVTGGNEYWNLTSLDYNVTLDLGSYQVSDISKIDFYVFVEEDNNGSYKYLGGEQGKLYTTINNPSETFEVTFNKDDIESLYTNDFSANHNGGAIASDLFEFKWVITHSDGSVLDTRSDCNDFDCTFGVKTKIIQVAPPIWEGTFNYEWTAATGNAIYYGGINVGDTGTMTLTLQPGSYTVYDVSDPSCDYYYGYGDPGVLSYNYETGYIELTSSTYDQVWTVADVSGPTITINWSYYYSQWYDEYGTFTLTRTDGEDWPSNINSNN